MRVIISLSAKAKNKKHDGIKVLKDKPTEDTESKKSKDKKVEEEEPVEDQQSADADAPAEGEEEDGQEAAPAEEEEEEEAAPAEGEEGEAPAEEEEEAAPAEGEEGEAPAEEEAAPAEVDGQEQAEEAPAEGGEKADPAAEDDEAEDAKPAKVKKAKAAPADKQAAEPAAPEKDEEETPKTDPAQKVVPTKTGKDSGVGVVKDYGKPTTPKFFTQSPAALELTKVSRVLVRLFSVALPASALRQVRYKKVGSGYTLYYDGFVVDISDADVTGGTQPYCFDSADAFIKSLRAYGAIPGGARVKADRGDVDDEDES